MDPKNKWNNKHTNRLHDYQESNPNKRLKNLSTYLTGSFAVDFACGLGENSLFLAKLNYQVKAFDISDVAVNHLKKQAVKQQLPILTRSCDLTLPNNCDIQDNSTDLVVITYYLDRMIFPYVKSIIKQGGYFFMETFYLTNNDNQRNVSYQYKLHPKELLSEFADWHILFYEECEQEGRQTIFARKN